MCTCGWGVHLCTCPCLAREERACKKSIFLHVLRLRLSFHTARKRDVLSCPPTLSLSTKQALLTRQLLYFALFSCHLIIAVPGSEFLWRSLTVEVMMSQAPDHHHYDWLHHPLSAVMTMDLQRSVSSVGSRDVVPAFAALAARASYVLCGLCHWRHLVAPTSA